MAARLVSRSGLWLVLGQVGGQAALIVAIPILTRHFEPSEMGLFQVATALGLILQPVATLRLDFIVPVARNRIELSTYKRTALRSHIVVVGMVTALAALSLAFESGSLTVTLLMAASLILAYGWMAMDSAFLVRRNQLARLAWRNLLSGVISAGLQLVGAIVIGHIASLALAVLIGRAVAIVLTRDSRSSDERVDHSGRSRPYTPRRASMAVSSSVVSALSLHSLPIYSGAAFGASAAGYVGIAQRAAGAPIGIVGQAVTQYTQASVAPYIRSDRGELRKLVVRQMVLLSFAASAAAALLMIFGPRLAVPVLGPGWGDAGVVIAILAIPMCFQLVISPLTSLYVTLAKEKILLTVQCCRFVGSLSAALAVQVLTGSFFGSVAAFSAGLTVAYIVTIVILLRILHQRELELRQSESSNGD